MNEDTFRTSSVKKKPRERPISSGEKQIIVNCYKSNKIKTPDIKYQDLLQYISKYLGVHLKCVRKVISEYLDSKLLSSPDQQRNNKIICDKLSNSDKYAIRKKIYNFWFNKKLPTIQQLVTAINDDKSLPDIKCESIKTLLKNLNFKFYKINQNSILLEKKKFIIFRRNYLRSVRQFREHGMPIYYLDKIQVNISDYMKQTSINKPSISNNMKISEELFTKSSNFEDNKNKLIVFHIGSENEVLPNDFLCFESKINITDNHNEKFQEWFKEISPLLKENAVIIVPYHSEINKNVPTMEWTKPKIMQWLVSRGEYVDPINMAKNDLMEIVKQIKIRFDSYVIDEILKNNITVLRLPSYLHKLNPLEMTLEMIKNHIQSNDIKQEIQDVEQLFYQAFDKVKKDDWESFITHVKQEEILLWNIDFICDNLVDNSNTKLCPDNTIPITDYNDSPNKD